MTTITRFTKEQLIARADHLLCVGKAFIAEHPEYDGMAKDVELFKIALASLEAEPVYFVEIEGDQDINAGRIQGKERPDLGALPDGINFLYANPPLVNSDPIYQVQYGDDWRDVERAQYDDHAAHDSPVRVLYTAPPARVVPDDLARAFISAIEKEQDRLFGEDYLMDSKDCIDVIREEMERLNACRAAMLQGSQPVSNRDELPLDYLQGHKDGLEWAAQLAEANHPQTGDWLYDDPTELAKAIRKGPDMPPVESGNPPVVPDGWIKCSERMPTKQDGTVFLTWNGQYIGKELFLMGSFQCLKPEIITHWMPLPAAPQQDEK